VVKAVLFFADEGDTAFETFNISTRDSLNVNQIANIAIEVLGLKSSSVKITYTGGDRGWKADVPIVKLDPSKIEATGWAPNFTSKRAMFDAIESMRSEISSNG
jgi:UDP-glucose 4-epimerase